MSLAKITPCHGHAGAAAAFRAGTGAGSPRVSRWHWLRLGAVCARCRVDVSVLADAPIEVERIELPLHALGTDDYRAMRPMREARREKALADLPSWAPAAWPPVRPAPSTSEVTPQTAALAPPPIP
jgi:hypothetical protein